MPAVDPKAVLEIDDIRRAMAYAEKLGPQPAALFAWMYEFGARAAEPGLQLVSDVDVRASRARPVHLKTNASARTGTMTKSDWHALLPFCRRVLPMWLEARKAFVQRPEQKDFLFPSSMKGHCYTCAGTGKRPILRRRADGKREREGTAKCHHCGGTGARPGIDRQEIYAIVTKVLRESGAPEGRQHPHVLRHSIITHLLEGGSPPTVVQDRVGHSSLMTTLAYARATRAAAAKLEGSLKGLYDNE